MKDPRGPATACKWEMHLHSVGGDEKSSVVQQRDDEQRKEQLLLSGKERITGGGNRVSYPGKSASCVSGVDPSRRRASTPPPGFGGDSGSGLQVKDEDSELARPSHLLAEIGKDVGTLSYHSSAADAESLRELERLKGGGSTYWASSQRIDGDQREREGGKADTLSRGYGFAQPDTGSRDLGSIDKEFERRVDRYSCSREDPHRKGCGIAQLSTGRELSSTEKEMEGRIDRYASSRDDSHRRGGAIPQPETGRESISVEKEMEGRVDRYASSRDNHSRDCEHGMKGPSPSGYDWRKRDRSSATHGSTWSPPFFSPTTTTQDSNVRFQGAFDMSASTQSPQVSPYSGASCLGLESGQDDASHLSPPKRPRLGWGQGLAKYEKKKVGDGDDASKFPPPNRGEALSKTESQSEEESPLDRTSISGSWVPASTSARALLPEISGEIVLTSTDTVSHKLEPGSSLDLRHSNSLPGASSALPDPAGALTDNPACRTPVNSGTSGASRLSPSLMPDQVEAPYLNRYLRLTRESDEAAAVQTKILNIEESKPALTSGVENDLSGWTKEAILLRVEKVEGEIDSVEKELAKLVREREGYSLEAIDCSTADQGATSHDVSQPASENMVQDAIATDDPTSANSLMSLPSPSMADSVVIQSVTEKVAEPVALLTALEESPLSSSMDLVHNEDLPPLRSSSACSGDTDQDGEADVLKEITNDLQPDENIPVDSNQLQLNQKDDAVGRSEFESKDMPAYQWSLVYSLLQENRKLAKEAAAPLSRLLSKDALYGRLKFYGTPEDAPGWRENVESHLKNQERMQLRLAERKKLLKFKERVLALKYKALKEDCHHGQVGMCQRRDRVKAVRRCEVERRNSAAFAITGHRSTLRLRPMLAIPVRLDAAQEEGQHVKKRNVAVSPANHLRHDLKMPPMIIDEKERSSRRFVSNNGLVEDPISYEQERKTMNPWTLEEKKIFLEKFTLFNKNFSKIASFLDHKRTADCVEYYYRNQKSEDFERIRRRQQLKKRRDYSVSGASYLATTASGHNRTHRDGSSTRVQALTLAAAAAYAESRDCSKSLRGSSHKVSDKARPTSTYDSGSLEHVVIKPVCGKESRAVSAPDAALSGISPGSLSAGTPSTSKNCRERLSARSGSGFVSLSKGLLSEQISGSKGMRSTPVHHNPSRMDDEENDSQWTDTERHLFTDAVGKYGKDFKKIADHVGSKTQTQCKTFFSKTRKRLRLDELVEQSQEVSLSDIARCGVPLKTESTCNENVEGLMEIAHSSSIETSGDQGEDKEADKCKLDTEEVNVANGLMMLGQVAEVSVVPLRVPESASDTSDLPSNVPDFAVKVPDLSAEVSDFTAEVSDIPSKVSDMLSKASDVPSQVLDLLSTKSGDPATVVTVVEEDALKSDNVLEKSMASLAHVEERAAEQIVKAEQSTDDAPVIDALVRIQKGAVDDNPMKHDPETAETVTGMSGESVKAVGDEFALTTDKPCGLLVAQAGDSRFRSVVVKAEPIMSTEVGGTCLPGMLPPTTQNASLAVTALPVIQSGQPRERGSRMNAAGEFKPRREPTSWTQEEKEKFAEIIRTHGKDWILLAESLPAKSLTQIKTYFQNSKAKLGFLSSDGHANLTARGNSTRKRKAEESDTSSNAGSAGQTPNPKVSLSTEDVSQKVIANSMMTINASIATPVVGADGLGYPHFNQSPGQSGDDAPNNVRDIQKMIRRMCSGNEYSSQSAIPGGIMPLFQPSITFPAPNSHQPLLLAAQKPQAVVGHQQQSLPPQAVLHQQQQLQQQQQTSPMTPSQRKMLSVVVKQLHSQAVAQQQQQQLQQQMQQQQTSQLTVQQPQIAHQLQQQVTQLVAAKQQQQQQQLAQAVKQIQPQLTPHHHSQQPLPVASVVHQQQLASRPKLLGQQQPQAGLGNLGNRAHLPASQQQAFLQQQQLLQQHKHQHQIHLLQQHYQQDQQMHHQLQSQKQQQQQPQQLQQLQQLHQLHQLQLQKEQAHHHVQQQQVQQQQFQQAMGLFRGPFQSFFADTDLLRQPEMLDQRNAASKLGLLPREDLPVQSQRGSQTLAQQSRTTPSSEPQRIRLGGDVKLFGQSLLSQPPSNAGGQPSISTPHKLWQTVTPASAVPVAIPSSSLSKVYGKDPVLLPSTFGRAGGSLLSGDGHSQSWPVGTTGHLDLWNCMLGGLHGAGFYKNEDAKSESSSGQDGAVRMKARVNQEVHDGEDSSTHPSLEPMETGGVQELQDNNGNSDNVRGVDALEVPSEAVRDNSRVENEWRNEPLQPSVGALVRPTTQQLAPALISQAAMNQNFAMPNAYSALIDKRSAQAVGKDELMQHIEAFRRESGNKVEGMSGNGASTVALAKLQLSGTDTPQLHGVYIAQPNSVQASLLNNVPKTSWASSLGAHASDSQPVQASTSFQSGALLRIHAGLEEASAPSDSRSMETSASNG